MPASQPTQNDRRGHGVAQRRRNLARQAAAAAARIALRYALGKYFDDIGEYERAFGNYRQANELTRRYGSNYDRAKLTRRVDDIIETFDAAFMRRRAAGASNSQLPVFIIGMPRSGTSLTEQILASHPAVFGAGELTFWGHGIRCLRSGGAPAATAERTS